MSDTGAKPRLILIKRGTYREKIYIEKHNIVFEGEGKENTVITNSIARDEWRCLHNDDWGTATVNIEGNDISFKNLAVVNRYGFDNTASKIIFCANDTSAARSKNIRRNGHQMALRTMAATRFSAINCSFKAYGGDTVSPWNTENGMFYFKDCDMEGSVDLYCPRGWAYAENCVFTSYSGEANVWHDGSKNKDAKTVLVNCSFKGFDGFNLARYHRDAQFFFMNCNFARNMSERDVFLVPTTNLIQWGRRVYFYNCHKEGGDLKWFENNLAASEEKPAPKNINASWVFDTRWDPIKNQ